MIKSPIDATIKAKIKVVMLNSGIAVGVVLVMVTSSASFAAA